MLGDVLFGFSEGEDAAANPSRRIAPSYAQSRFGQNRSSRGCSRAKVLLSGAIPHLPHPSFEGEELWIVELLRWSTLATICSGQTWTGHRTERSVYVDLLPHPLPPRNQTERRQAKNVPPYLIVVHYLFVKSIIYLDFLDRSGGDHDRHLQVRWQSCFARSAIRRTVAR